jgi:hypothetical protein
LKEFTPNAPIPFWSDVFVFASGLVLADVGPPPPQPLAGPRTAVIRGVTVEQVYTYLRGRRWLVIISGCGSNQAACNGRNLAGCFVIGINGLDISGGNIAALIDSDSAAGDAPIKLMLDQCEIQDISLSR